MPKGVICGGAVDGSNQLGEIVTNHAMMARPDGAGAAAMEAEATRPTAATTSDRMNAQCTRKTWNDVMRTLRAARCLSDWSGSKTMGRGQASVNFAPIVPRMRVGGPRPDTDASRDATSLLSALAFPVSSVGWS